MHDQSTRKFQIGPRALILVLIGLLVLSRLRSRAELKFEAILRITLTRSLLVIIYSQ
jgi:hypothetical protein